jgi:acetate kinase
MKVLVANLGSTSFKYRLFDMSDERQLARGGTERIGSAESRSFAECKGDRRELLEPVPDHAAAVRKCLEQLTDPVFGCLASASEVAAIGFKAVHGGRFSGVQRVTPEVLAEMERMAHVAPAHNPPYVAAMRLLCERLGEIPLVAAFETGFHQTIPDRHRYYGIPFEWAQEGLVQRWGFHGASHRYIAGRIGQLLGRPDLRVISCHLGGSSSLSAIRNGQSVANSLGMSPQSGLPHNNRVGDFDVFALPILLDRTGKPLAEVLEILAGKSGLVGLSGISGDVRDLEKAADLGHARARLALEVLIGAARHYLGAYLVELGGADAVVFTGGIGENSPRIRSGVCGGLENLGIALDPEKNRSAQGECAVHAEASRTQVWTLPTNEELIVARQACECLRSATAEGGR